MSTKAELLVMIDTLKIQLASSQASANAGKHRISQLLASQVVEAPKESDLILWDYVDKETPVLPVVVALLSRKAAMAAAKALAMSSGKCVRV
jgi:hypothetical protein